MWKKKKPQRSLPRERTDYPDGIVLETETGFFLLRQQKFYRLPTQRILDSWNFPLIVQTTDEAVKHYRRVAKLGFRDGSLIHNIYDGKLYLISNNKRRPIVNPDVLNLLGKERSDAITVSEFEVNLQELGDPLG